LFVKWEDCTGDINYPFGFQRNTRADEHGVWGEIGFRLGSSPRLQEKKGVTYSRRGRCSQTGLSKACRRKLLRCNQKLRVAGNDSLKYSGMGDDVLKNSNCTQTHPEGYRKPRARWRSWRGTSKFKRRVGEATKTGKGGHSYLRSKIRR